MCDQQYLQGELRNNEEVFIENGYTKREIRNAMEDRNRADETDDTERENSRGIVSIPNVPTFTRAFGRIAKQHKFTSITFHVGAESIRVQGRPIENGSERENERG